MNKPAIPGNRVQRPHWRASLIMTTDHYQPPETIGSSACAGYRFMVMAVPSMESDVVMDLELDS